jgi:hypothetical protein
MPIYMEMKLQIWMVIGRLFWFVFGWERGILFISILRPRNAWRILDIKKRVKR